MDTVRVYLINIINNELKRIDGGFNGKMARTKKYDSFRSVLFEYTKILDSMYTIQHRIVWVLGGYTDKPRCKNCNHPTTFQRQTQRFNIHCSRKCIQNDNDVRAKQEQTNFNRYGVKYGCIAPSAREKQIKTNMKKYGVAKPFQSKHVQQKVRKNTFEKYGVISTAQLPKIAEHQQQTRLNKYGYTHIFKSPEKQEEITQTHLKKFGQVRYSKGLIAKDTVQKLENQAWMLSEYCVLKKSAIHIAEELHVSDITVGNYLRKHKISIRHKCNFSHKSINWIKQIEQEQNVIIQHQLTEDGEFLVPGTNYRVDGLCRETNTIYEFYGDYWHGNPKNPRFPPHQINTTVNVTFGELYQRTINREDALKQLGYNVVSIWESDYDQQLSPDPLPT